MTFATVGRASTEVLISPVAKAVAARAATEVLIKPIPKATAARTATEVLILPWPKAKMARLQAEYLVANITTTTFSDDFQRADASTPGGIWQVASGSWGISSQQLAPTGAGIVVLETTQTAGQITLVPSVIGSLQVVFWFVDTSNYWSYDLPTGNLNSLVSGASTTVGTASSLPGANTSVSVTMRGDNVTVAHNDATVLTYTATGSTKGTKQGVGNGSGGNTGRGKHVGWVDQGALDALLAGWGIVPIK